MICDYVVTRCTDTALLNDICLDPALVESISDDFFDKEHYSIEKDGVWLKCDRAAVCVGMVQVKIASPLDLRVHIVIPKKHRVNCCLIGKAFVAFLEQNKGRYIKLSTRVAEKYDNVIRFTERLGFTVDGVDKLSYQQDGQLYDTVLMSYIFK